jgi:hypothetical protein
VEKISTALFASDDLADPRVIKPDQLADVSKREAVLLGLSEGFASSVASGLAVPLELLLSRFDGLAGSLAL